MSGEQLPGSGPPQGPAGPPSAPRSKIPYIIAAILALGVLDYGLQTRSKSSSGAVSKIASLVGLKSKPAPLPVATPDAGEGAKAKKEEGKVGKKDARMEKAKGNKVEMQERRLDREIMENAGVLGALRDGAELDGVFGSSGLDSALEGGIGGLIGAKGTQYGAGGLGSRGSGLGGLGTKGRGSGASGYGSGRGNSGGEGGIGRIGGDPIVMGSMDKALIDRVIKRKMNQIRHCYQQELNKDPNLVGKISVYFIIAKDGTVSKARTKKSTMGNSTVERCINKRFMRFQFPEPKGGGIVMVTYPFIFSNG